MVPKNIFWVHYGTLGYPIGPYSGQTSTGVDQGKSTKFTLIRVIYPDQGKFGRSWSILVHILLQMDPTGPFGAFLSISEGPKPLRMVWDSSG